MIPDMVYEAAFSKKSLFAETAFKLNPLCVVTSGMNIQFTSCYKLLGADVARVTPFRVLPLNMNTP
jgi:hypothetical protein